MNNDITAINTLINKINLLITKRIKGLKYDKTFAAVIYEVNSDGTYNIFKENQKYTVKTSLPGSLPPLQAVWVKIPCGELKNMFICGLR